MEPDLVEVIALVSGTFEGMTGTAGSASKELVVTVGATDAGSGRSEASTADSASSRFDAMVSGRLDATFGAADPASRRLDAMVRGADAVSGRLGSIVGAADSA